MNQKQKVYSLVSVLLQYPEKEWLHATAGLKAEISSIRDQVIRTSLAHFLDYLKSTPYDELCENYVYTFDFYEKTTLYLTHSVFKDNRERGAVLVQLRQEFYKAGLEFTSEELPDYLPLILEFTAIAPEDHAERILGLHKRAIGNLQLELMGINSPYQHLLSACVRNMAERNEDEKVS